VLRTQPAPSIVVDVQLLPQPRNVVSRTSSADYAILVPTYVGQIGDLIDTTTIANTSSVKPRLREEMMHFAGGA
jgi:hypothetical protein